MRKFFYIIAIIFLSSNLPTSVSAQQQQAQQRVFVNDDYANKLENTISELGEELRKTSDPRRKVEIVSQMNSLYNAYYHPSMRLHFIAKKYPEYARMILQGDTLTDAQRQELMYRDAKRRRELSDQELFISKDILTSPWDTLSEEQRQQACEEASTRCLDGDEMRFCRFTASRCKPYVEEEIYDEVTRIINGTN